MSGWRRLWHRACIPHIHLAGVWTYMHMSAVIAAKVWSRPTPDPCKDISLRWKGGRQRLGWCWQWLPDYAVRRRDDTSGPEMYGFNVEGALIQQLPQLYMGGYTLVYTFQNVGLPSSTLSSWYPKVPLLPELGPFAIQPTGFRVMTRHVPYIVYSICASQPQASFQSGCTAPSQLLHDI